MTAARASKDDRNGKRIEESPWFPFVAQGCGGVNPLIGVMAKFGGETGVARFCAWLGRRLR
jgi:hypothetical protein